MAIAHKIFQLPTEAGIQIYNITPQVTEFLALTGIQQGQALMFSRHTTTALTINEYEVRLLDDIKAYLQKLAPAGDHYGHNDLHLRPGIPADEPMNAHSHLMAMTLGNSETVPIVAGQLALGTWQSILLVELDGPRQRTFFCQLSGE